MKVEIYDQYKDVYAADGVTLLHKSEGSTTGHGEFITPAEVTAKVTELYNESKTLGETFDISVDLSKGYAELIIKFADGKTLQRVIYTVQ